MYTDDGNGDGSIVPVDATRLLAFTESVTAGNSGYNLTPALFAPLVDIVSPSRKELREEYDRRMDVYQEIIGVPLFTLRAKPEILATEQYEQVSVIDPFYLIHLLMPALEKAVIQGELARAKRDATLAVLYVVQEHNRSGVWPTELSSAGVVDAWNNKPFNITQNDGTVVLYSVGYDTIDDGGVDTPNASRWNENSTGDWVIWSTSE